MKRFYCTICNRVKRVRSYPQDIRTPNSNEVMDRVGTCARHSAEPVMQKYAKAHNIEVVELNMLKRSKRRA